MRVADSAATQREICAAVAFWRTLSQVRRNHVSGFSGFTTYAYASAGKCCPISVLKGMPGTYCTVHTIRHERHRNLFLSNKLVAVRKFLGVKPHADVLDLDVVPAMALATPQPQIARGHDDLAVNATLFVNLQVNVRPTVIVTAHDGQEGVPRAFAATKIHVTPPACRVRFPGRGPTSASDRARRPRSARLPPTSSSDVQTGRQRVRGQWRQPSAS